jgi:hypothetical protein
MTYLITHSLCVLVNGVIALSVSPASTSNKTADAQESLKNELGEFYNLCTIHSEFDRFDFRIHRERLSNEQAPRPFLMTTSLPHHKSHLQQRVPYLQL